MIEFLLLKVDVAHVHSQSGGLRVLLVFQNDGVGIECFLVQVVGVVHIRKVVEHVESQVYVDLVEGAGVFSKLSNLLFFGGCLLGLLKSGVDVLVELAPGTVFQKTVDFFFELFEVFFLRLLLLLFDGLHTGDLALISLRFGFKSG